MIDDSKIDRLDRFGKALLSKRQKAIQARKKSGIEEIWDQDSEYYEGIDDANRGEVSTSITKNLVDRGGYSRVNRKRTGSNVFMNITKQYTDIAAMSLADMLLPVDDANFEVRPTPKPATMELLQVKPVDVYRDADKDIYSEMTAIIDRGLFGINIHKANTGITNFINGHSAGCQVFQNSADFDYIISECKKSGLKEFTYTLIDEF